MHDCERILLYVGAVSVPSAFGLSVTVALIAGVDPLTASLRAAAVAGVLLIVTDLLRRAIPAILGVREAEPERVEADPRTRRGRDSA